MFYNFTGPLEHSNNTAGMFYVYETRKHFKVNSEIRRHKLVNVR